MRAEIIGPAAELELPALPISSESVPAGFPSPAQDYWSGDLNVGEMLIRDRAATYLVRAHGSSMTRAGIFDGSILVVDRGLEARDGRIVVAIVDGELTVKRLRVQGGEVLLQAEGDHHPHIRLHELSELTIWGVVTWVLSPTPAAAPVLV